MFGWFKRFDDGSRQISGEMAKGIFHSIMDEIPVSRADHMGIEADVNYLVLKDHRMKAFVFKHHDPNFASYGQNSKEDGESFPDCDDFADWAKGDIGKGAVIEGMSRHPVFGLLAYFTPKGTPHRANWAIWLEDDPKTGVERFRLRIFEPQNGTWYPDDYVHKIRYIRWARF